MLVRDLARFCESKAGIVLETTSDGENERAVHLALRDASIFYETLEDRVACPHLHHKKGSQKQSRGALPDDPVRIAHICQLARYLALFELLDSASERLLALCASEPVL